MARAPLVRAEVRPRRLALPDPRAVRGIVPAAALGAVFVAVRLVVALSPPLRETYYDEALTGLMSLAILRGVPQVFYWVISKRYPHQPRFSGTVSATRLSNSGPLV